MLSEGWKIDFVETTRVSNLNNLKLSPSKHNTISKSMVVLIMSLLLRNFNTHNGHFYFLQYHTCTVESSALNVCWWCTTLHTEWKFWLRDEKTFACVCTWSQEKSSEFKTNKIMIMVEWQPWYIDKSMFLATKHHCIRSS